MPGDGRIEPIRFTIAALPLDPIADEAIARVYALWNTRRGARSMPAPGEILPEEFGIALGKVNLIEVLRDPLRFVYRVRGSIIAGLSDQDMKGREVAEMQPPEYRDMVLAHYAEVAVSGVPSHYRIQQRRRDVCSEYRRMVLPLGVRPGLVERLLTVSAWEADFAQKAVQLGFKRR